MKEECRQGCHPQDSAAPPVHQGFQPHLPVGEVRCRDSGFLQTQEKEGLTEEEDEDEKEEDTPPNVSFYPSPGAQSLDPYCQPRMSSPSPLSPTHRHHHHHHPGSVHPPSTPSSPFVPPSSSYHNITSPSSPMHHPSLPVSESIPAFSKSGGVHHYPQSLPAPPPAEQKQGLQQHHFLSDQVSFQKQNPVQGQWLQPAKVPGVRTSQPNFSFHPSAALGGPSYPQFVNLPQELAELGEGLCTSPLNVRRNLPVQTALNSGASYPPEGADDLICQARALSAYGRGAAGDNGGVNHFVPPRQFSRNQSKAAYYPMEVTEATPGPLDNLAPLHEYQYHNPGGPRRPLSAHPTTTSASSNRPLNQSASVCFPPSSGHAGGQAANHGSPFRTSFSTQHMDSAPDGSSGTGYADDLFLLPSSQSEGGMSGGGTYPGEVGRSSRSTPFMGVTDKTVRVHQQFQQPVPSSSSSCLSPSRSWAVSSVDTVVTSPSKNPGGHAGFSHPPPSSIAYHNRSNNNAHNGHLLHDDQLNYYEVLPSSGRQGEGLVQVASHIPPYVDVKLARTLPVIHGCSDRPAEQKTGPTSPVKPKRPFVESNV